MRALTAIVVLALAAAVVPARPAAAEVARIEAGNRISENLPEIPPDLIESLNRYQNTRGASFQGWLDDGSILIGTRFGDTAQVHRVERPLGAREQVTFYREPVRGVAIRPGGHGPGFLFSKDTGGDEFFQLHFFDLSTRRAVQLTEGRPGGGKVRNEGVRWSGDGRRLAWSSTLRNGTDTDVWVRDLDGEPRLLLQEGGAWNAHDFSPDGGRLLVSRFVSIEETRPGEVDLATGKLTPLPVAGGRAAVTGLQYAKDGRGIYYISDEGAEFLRLRRRDTMTGDVAVVSLEVPWNVTGFAQSRDGTRLAYVTNEDGISVLRVVRVADLALEPLPALPIGQVGGLEFSPDGNRLALSLNTATSPADVYVVDLAAGEVERWTRSEVGGLDTGAFVAPTLIRYESFDGRSIPAFYYRPAGVPADQRLPVVVSIHGGPESQALPVFNPAFQYLLRELQVAVLVPNVRGSSGYGKTWLQLDNGFLRKDSVRDIGALLDWIAIQPGLDPERVGVTGGSYGGYMVLAAMVDYGDRIRAGVDIVGISSFRTFLENTEDYRRDLRRAEYGDERDPAMRAFHDEIAPLNNAHRITKPLFVAQGFNDPRVPWTEAEQIVRAVRGGGGEVWFLMFKDEGHGFAKKPNADYFGAAQVQFWRKHLLGG
ncbi:MAG: S9 family peptidase [bacterium]|nr:S9 family peptidase [bacterium]